MDHRNLNHQTSTTDSTAPMLVEEDAKVVILTPSRGKILIREDTILANLQGCAGCGGAKFTCAGMHKQWSVLCWGRQSDRKYYTLITLLAATFVLSLIGTVFFCFTNTINDAILSSMVIRNNSLAYRMWKDPQVEPLMKVHLFNYTNWDRVRDGLDDRLHVEDVGPYVYSQRIERVNVYFQEDRLTFQERNTFRYEPQKTAGSAHSDKIFVPNLPLIGAISKSVDSNINYLGHMLLNTGIRHCNHPDAFIQLSAHDFLWGYDDDIIDIARPILSFSGQLNFGKNFGLLASKNGTVSDRLTINTGAVDKDRMNFIERLNGEDHLHYWSSPECNSLDATDGTIFPPTMLEDKSKPLHVFYPQLCRRIPFEYEKDIEMSDGIQLMRYRMPANVFDDPIHNKDNDCYCQIDQCPPRGVINVTSCAMGAPALASFPHFFHGDKSLRESITGLNPDPLLHDNYFDLHPTLGIALGGRSSMQMNIQIRKASMYQSLDFLPQGLILPIAWVDMSVDELPEGLRSLVYHGTYSTAAAQLGLIAVSIITLVISSICLCMLLVSKRRKPCATVKVPESELNKL